MLKIRSLAIALLLAAISIPAAAYTVYLKDGTRFIAREKPRIEGGKAIILLQSGTRTSLDASEVDFARSEEANQNNLGTALVLDNGQFTDTPQGLGNRSRRITDIARGDQTLKRGAPSASAEAAAAATAASDPDKDPWNPERKPYRDLETSSKILGVFRAHGIDSVQVLRGSSDELILLDVTTDSEGSIFRGLEAAAAALVEISESSPDTIAGFEVLMMTSNRGRAGRFVLGPDTAAEIAGKRVDPSAFFVQKVQF